MKLLLVIVGVVAVGLVGVAVFDWWRLGSALVGVALALAAALRLTLPKEHLGDLAVRSRVVDATILLTIGFGLVALANTIPHG